MLNKRISTKWSFPLEYLTKFNLDWNNYCLRFNFFSSRSVRLVDSKVKFYIKTYQLKNSLTLKSKLEHAPKSSGRSKKCLFIRLIGAPELITSINTKQVQTNGMSSRSEHSHSTEDASAYTPTNYRFNDITPSQ